MSISTKKGDRGETSLVFGERVSKDDLRIEMLGCLDEMCCFLGLAKSRMKADNNREVIEGIQRDLFVAGSQIGTLERDSKKLSQTIDENYVAKIDRALHKLENDKGFEVNGFCIPGESFLSGLLDTARALTRKAERRAVTLKRKGVLQNRYILVYLNRISDLLYLMARFYSAHSQRLNDVGEK